MHQQPPQTPLCLWTAGRNGPGRFIQRCHTRSDHRPLEFIRPHRDNQPKKIAVGFISHRTLQVETPEEIVADVRQALEYIDAEHLVLSSDCGFGRQGVPRPIAFYKAAAIAQGANIVRRELGAPVR